MAFRRHRRRWPWMTLYSHFALNTVFRVELFSMDALVLRHDCFKIDGDAYMLSAAKMCALSAVVFGDISLMQIFVGVRWWGGVKCKCGRRKCEKGRCVDLPGTARWCPSVPSAAYTSRHHPDPTKTPVFHLGRFVRSCCQTAYCWTVCFLCRWRSCLERSLCLPYEVPHWPYISKFTRLRAVSRRQHGSCLKRLRSFEYVMSDCRPTVWCKILLKISPLYVHVSWHAHCPDQMCFAPFELEPLPAVA